MREIVDGIFKWPWFSARHQYNFNGYLLKHAAGTLCIDPVEADATTIETIAANGVTEILITNRNHVRAANAVRARTGARARIHAADAEYARGQGAELDADLPI